MLGFLDLPTCRATLIELADLLIRVRCLRCLQVKEVRIGASDLAAVCVRLVLSLCETSSDNFFDGDDKLVESRLRHET